MHCTKCLVFVYLLLVFAHLCIATDNNNFEIVSEYNRQTDNGYEFHYKTKDGTSRTDMGTLGVDADGNEVLRVSGSYSYKSPNGQEITVFYTADENGYRPKIVFGLLGEPKPSIGVPYSGPAFPILRIGPNAIASLTGGGIG